MADYFIMQYPALPTVVTVPNVPRRIDMLVLHATAGVKTSDLPTLAGRNKRHLVSTHYYVTKIGEIYQLVQDKDIAWHAGVSFWQGENDCNRFSIGIEMENLNDGRDPYPQVQQDAVLWIVRSKVQQYTIPRSRLVRHAEIALPPGRKTDPRGFPWESFVERVYDLEPTHYIMRVTGWLRTGPSTQFSRASFDGGATRVLLPEGKVLTGAMVEGEPTTVVIDGTPITSDQWLHWIEDGNENGFVWSGLLLPAYGV